MSPQSPNQILIFRRLSWSLLATLCLCGAATAERQSLTIYNDASDDAYLDLGQPGSIGDKILWRSEMQTFEGDPVGLGSGHCSRLDTDGNFFCSFIINLDDRGTIAGQGVQRTEPTPSVFPITGGTGAFEGIVGEMTSYPVEQRARFVYEINYRLP